MSKIGSNSYTISIHIQMYTFLDHLSLSLAYNMRRGGEWPRERVAIVVKVGFFRSRKMNDSKCVTFDYYIVTSA